jgi:single-stranded DNA-binding protein
MFSRCILVGRMVRDPEFQYIRKSQNTLALNSLID